MSTTPAVKSTLQTSDAWTDEAIEPEFKALTPEEAAKWRSSQPALSAWRVVSVQLLVGLLMGVLAWLFTRSLPVTESVLYGAAAVVIPTALMAWGVTSSSLSRRSSGHVIPMFMNFVVWEGVKILLTVAMLWSAPKMIPGLHWLALLVGLVVVLKVYWFGFWIQARRR